MAITTLSALEIKVTSGMTVAPPTNTVLDALRSAWFQLLNESEVWVEELDAIDAVADQASYTLTHADGIVVRISKVTINDGIVSPTAYKMTGTSTLTFEDDYIPAESDADAIVVEVVLVPDINEEDGPEWVMNRLFDGIVHGARSYLYDMPHRPWTRDANMAAIKKEQSDRIFGASIGEAILSRTQNRTTRETGIRAFSA